MTMFKRRREQKTDYAQRFSLLKSGKPRLVVRRALNNIHIQIIVSDDGKDKTVTEVISKSLKKYGWKGHCGNLPAAYLTGYIAGLSAAKHNIKEAIVDIGLKMSVKASSLYAAVYGAKDAGLSVSIGKEVLPSKERVSGEHISNYAQKLKSEPEKYKKQFSAYLRNGLQPEDLQQHFKDIKEKIDVEFNVTKKVVKATQE